MAYSYNCYAAQFPISEKNQTDSSPVFQSSRLVVGLVRVVMVPSIVFTTDANCINVAALQPFTGIKFWFKFYSASGVTDPEAKREHEVKTIGTHDGTFRCREALACYMLKVLPEYKDAGYVIILLLLCSTA